MPEKGSCRRTKAQRSLIVDEAIFIDAEIKKDNQNPNLFYQNSTFIKNFTYKSGFPLLLTPARPTGEGEPIMVKAEVEAAALCSTAESDNS
jgi:hypothetical protein